MSFKPFLAYSASAGSGKTFALSVRYISLLFMGEAPSSILAATFTNKAAAEMRQRVVDSLRNLGENEAFLHCFSSVQRCGNCCDGRIWQQSSGRGNIV